MSKLKAFLKDTDGATAIEYGLIALFISIAIITGARTTGTNVGTIFGKVSNGLT